jgi:ATPase family associated with various cellular activities (AAA)
MEPLKYQRQAVAEITARARVFFSFHDTDYREIGIRPRWASILIAPTGSGKTFVASHSALACGASFCRASAPSWMPLGANNRGAKETVGVIAAHVAQHDKTILCVDEIDKLVDRAGDNSWKSYVRNELFDLIDGRWPNGLSLPDSDDDGPDITIEQLGEKLQKSVFVLGVGTFQEWFDDTTSRRTIGFGSALNPEKNEITADNVAERLPRELANRFHSSIIRLPELLPSDYHRIAQEAESKLPARMREAFRAEAQRCLPEAIASKKGFRYLEECMLTTLISLRCEPSPPIPDLLQPTPDINQCTL